MSPRIYPLYKQAAERDDPDVSLDENTIADGIYAVLCGSGYSYDDAHQFYPSILPHIVSTADQRIENAVVDGLAVLDGDNVIFPTISSTAVSIVIYRRNSGLNSTWRLVYFYDNPVGGLPLTPIGSGVGVNWNALGIYKL